MSETPTINSYDVMQMQNVCRREFKSISPKSMIEKGFFAVDGIGVEWHHGYDNSPGFILRCKKEAVPDHHTMRYQQKGSLYFAEYKGLVYFYSWKGPHNEGGFGKSDFPITLESGEEVTLRGPWSSNPAAMNRAGFKPSLDVRLDVYTNPDRPWDVMHLAAHVSLDLIKTCLRLSSYFVWLCEEREMNVHPRVKGTEWDSTGTFGYYPVMRSSAPKGFVQFGQEGHYQKQWRFVAPFESPWQNTVLLPDSKPVG